MYILGLVLMVTLNMNKTELRSKQIIELIKESGGEILYSDLLSKTELTIGILSNTLRSMRREKTVKMISKRGRSGYRRTSYKLVVK